MEYYIIEIYKVCKRFLDNDYDFYRDSIDFEYLNHLCDELHWFDPNPVLKLHPHEFREIFRYIEPKFNEIELGKEEKAFIAALAGYLMACDVQDVKEYFCLSNVNLIDLYLAIEDKFWELLVTEKFQHKFNINIGITRQNRKNIYDIEKAQYEPF